MLILKFLNNLSAVRKSCLVNLVTNSLPWFQNINFVDLSPSYGLNLTFDDLSSCIELSSPFVDLPECFESNLTSADLPLNFESNLTFADLPGQRIRNNRVISSYSRQFFFYLFLYESCFSYVVLLMEDQICDEFLVDIRCPSIA